MKKPRWTIRPAKQAFATNEGWELIYSGKQKLIRPHKGLLDTLTKEGYDQYGEPVSVGMVAEGIAENPDIDIVDGADAIAVTVATGTDEEAEKAFDKTVIGVLVETIKRGRGRPRKDGTVVK